MYDRVMAKYESLRKIERNKAVCEYAEAHQGMSQKEIGKVFGISGSRVSRIQSANLLALQSIK